MICQDYEALLAAGIDVIPVCNQIEVNPLMYRREVIDHFQGLNIPIVVCTHPLLLSPPLPPRLSPEILGYRPHSFTPSFIHPSLL